MLELKRKDGSNEISRLQKLLKGLQTLLPFPLTTLFLIGAVVVNSIDIQGGGDYSKYLLTLIVELYLGQLLK